MTRFELFPFQKIGVETLLSTPSLLLADEMGLGKTVQVLESIRQIGKGNFLIVCPASLALMWDTDIRKWFYDLDVQIVHLKSATPSIAPEGQLRFIIVSYNFIQKPENIKRLLKARWSVIVADEAHAIKNWKTKTCRGFVALTKKKGVKVFMLTGTPATKNGQDYYPYLEIMQPGKWGTFSQFSAQFCNVVKDYWSGYDKYEGVKESMKPVLKRAFMKVKLRRLKKDVAKELPRMLSKYLPVEVSPDIVAACLDLDESLVQHIIDTGGVMPAHVASVMRSIGMGKVEAACEYLSSVFEPIVVFCTHTDVINAIEEFLVEENKPVRTVTGEDSALEKHRAVEDFQGGRCDYIICNIKAGGVGITLHRASHMLMVEQWWSPAILEQAMARILRFGQVAKCVNVTHLIAHKTIDEQILEALKYKSKFMKEVMNDFSN